MKALEKDPFRLLFPLGVILALLGVGPWTLQLVDNSTYPRELHRIFMMNGFLLSFVCGFLMTAVPKFTASFPATKFEVLAVLLGLIGTAGAVFTLPAGAPYLFSAFVVFSVMVFAGRRLLKRTSNPPYTFVFIGVGLTFWLVSDLLLGASNMPPEVVAMANDFFSNGAIMCLILGVGGRLIPGILGWEEIVAYQRRQYENDSPFLKVVPLEVWIATLVFVSSFFLPLILPFQLCLILRGLVTSFFAFRYWRLYRLPKTRSYLTWSIWISAWSLVFGYFLPALWPEGAAHAMHLLFIAGFSLLTLLIGMRVTLAHGAIGTGIETRAWSILAFTGIVVFAMITRVTAILWPNIYLHHLGYAAVIWIFGLLVWSSLLLFGKKEIRVRK